MPRKWFDQEVWEAMVDAIETRFLRTEFEEGEFRVEHNDAMQTITVIRTEDRRAWELMDTTGSHLTGGRNPGDPIVVHLTAGG